MGLVPGGKLVLPTLQPAEADFFSKGGSLNLSKTSVYGKIPKQSFTIRSTDMEKISLEQEINSNRISIPLEADWFTIF